MPLNSDVREDSWESLGHQGDQTSRYYGKSTLNTCSKDWCWSWNSNILVIWTEQLTHWKVSWVWKRLKAEREEGIRSWVASPMQCTWTWANFVRWWRTERPGCCIPSVAKSQTTLGDWTMIFDLIFFSQSIKCCKEIEKLLHGKCQPSPCKYILSILGVCFTENDFSS